MKKTVNGYRVVLDVDPGWFEAIAEMTSYREYGEVMKWVSTTDTVFEVEVCDVCEAEADDFGDIDHDSDAHKMEEEL